MLRLIWKDLLVQKKSWWTVAVLPMFMLIAFANQPEAALIAGPLAVAYVLVIMACVYDEKNKTDLLWCSLPISRKTIIGAKYLAALTFILLGILVVTVYGFIIKFFGIPLPIEVISLEDIFGIIMATSLFVALFFPLYFKFGYAKTRYFGILVYVLLFMAPQILNKGLEDNAELAALVQKITSGLSGAVIALFLLGISYFVSVGIYQQKDLT